MIANVRDFIHSERCDRLTMGSKEDMSREYHYVCTLKKDIGSYKKGYKCSHITVNRLDWTFTFPDDNVIIYTDEMDLHNNIIDIVEKSPIDRLDLATAFFKTSVDVRINILEFIDVMIFNRDIIALDYISLDRPDKIKTLLFPRNINLTEKDV